MKIIKISTITILNLLSLASFSQNIEDYLFSKIRDSIYIPKKNSFSEYISKYPYKNKKQDIDYGYRVFSYDGKPTDKRTRYLLDIPLPKDNTLQCADLVYYFAIKYLEKTKQYDKMKFSTYDDKTISYKGGSIDEFIHKVYTLCNVWTLNKECVSISINDVVPGDLILIEGTNEYKNNIPVKPGHVAIIKEVYHHNGDLFVQVAETVMPSVQPYMISEMTEYGDYNSIFEIKEYFTFPEAKPDDKDYYAFSTHYYGGWGFSHVFPKTSFKRLKLFNKG